MRILIFLYLFGVVPTLPRVIEEEPLSEEPEPTEYVQGADLEDEAEISEEESKRRLGIIVSRLDRDENGKVDKEELKEWMRRTQRREAEEDAFKQLLVADENEDGIMDWEEFYKATYGRISEADMKEDGRQNGFSYAKLTESDRKKWESADLDRDNRLSRKELMSFLHPDYYDHMKDVALRETFEGMDENDNGFIDLEEYVADDFESEEDGEEPDWIKTQKDIFNMERDTNNDGKLDKEEIRSWIFPEGYDPIEVEASYLIQEGDSNKDNHLTKEEIIEHHSIFVGSHITNWGVDMKRHDEF